MSIAANAQRWLTRHAIAFELLEHPRSCGARDTALAAHVPLDHIAKGVLVGDAGFEQLTSGLRRGHFGHQ